MEIIAAIVGSSLVTGIVTTGINQWLISRKEKRTSKAKALEFAVKLEGFALDCANLISGVDGDGHFAPRETIICIPEPPKIEISTSYISSNEKINLSDEILCFPQFVIQSNDHIQHYMNFIGDHDQAGEVAIYEAKSSGNKALDLAFRLRNLYGLSSRSLVFGKYDARNILKEGFREP